MLTNSVPLRLFFCNKYKFSIFKKVGITYKKIIKILFNNKL